MHHTRNRFCWACLFVVISVVAIGQELTPLPAPVTTGSPGGDDVTTAATSPSTHGGTIVQTLVVISQARQALCDHVRQSPIGQLAGQLRKPLSTATGGLIPAVRQPTTAELSHPGPQGTAAQVQASQLEAPKRRAAVQALRGIDVRYYPEVADMLIAALRTDPSECVRMEAAIALTSIPRCTKPVAQALDVCASGESSDGNPCELSSRVRIQADIALAGCQDCLPLKKTPASRPEYPENPVPDSPAVVQTMGLRESNSERFKGYSQPIPSLIPTERYAWLSENYRPLQDIRSSVKPAPIPFSQAPSLTVPDPPKNLKDIILQVFQSH